MLKTLLSSYTVSRLVRDHWHRPRINRPFRHRLKGLLAYEYLTTDDGKDFTFAVVGANDGTTGEVVHDLATRRRCRGLCVEPDPRFFRLLEEAYRNVPGVSCVNVAIHETEASMPFYAPDPSSSDPEWVGGVGSFYKERVLRHLPEERIRAFEVPCRRLMDLLHEHDLRQLSYLQIDTEGYDLRVLQSVDFVTLRPRLIRFEDAALSRSEVRAAYSLLQEHGYSLWPMNESDTVAVLENRSGWRWSSPAV